MLIACFISHVIQRIASLVIFMLCYIILLQNQSGYSATHLPIKEIKNNSKIELQSALYHFNNILRSTANLL